MVDVASTTSTNTAATTTAATTTAANTTSTAASSGAAIANPFSYRKFNSVESSFMLKAAQFFAGKDGYLSLSEARRAAYYYAEAGDQDVALAFANIWRGLRYGDAKMDKDKDGYLDVYGNSNELTQLAAKRGETGYWLSYADFVA